MQSYHYAWLSVHPYRTAEWLKAKLAEGFDVHHRDGNHENNDPANLVLIECVDHMRLHGGGLNRMIPRKSGRTRRRKSKVVELPKRQLPDDDLLQ